MGKGRGWGFPRGTSTQGFKSMKNGDVFQFSVFCVFTRDFSPSLLERGQEVRPQLAVKFAFIGVHRRFQSSLLLQFFAAFARDFPLHSGCLKKTPGGGSGAGGHPAQALTLLLPRIPGSGRCNPVPFPSGAGNRNPAIRCTESRNACTTFARPGCSLLQVNPGRIGFDCMR